MQFNILVYIPMYEEIPNFGIAPFFRDFTLQILTDK